MLEGGEAFRSAENLSVAYAAFARLFHLATHEQEEARALEGLEVLHADDGNDDETITHRLDLDVDSLSVLVDALRDANAAVAFAG